MTKTSNNHILYIVILCITTALLHTSCSNTKYLPKGASLYVGSDVDFKNHNATKREEKVMKNDLEAAVRPKPNKKLLGMRIKLAIYNRVDTPKKKKGIRNWLKYKVGEPPVLLSDVNIGFNQKLMVNVLENHGFFFPEVSVNTDTKNKKTKLHFEVRTDKQYKIRNYYYPDSAASALKGAIYMQHKESLLKPGAPYNLDLIKGERERVTNQVKNRGFYYFLPDYLLAQVDTTVGDHQVDIDIKVKDSIPHNAREAYFINKVFIEPNHKLSTKTLDTATQIQDTLKYGDYYIIGDTKKYKPSIFKIAMQYKPREAYNRTDQAVSLSRLVNMGTFKFVKNEFNEPPDTNNVLNVLYTLTPFPKKSLQTEIGAVTKNDSRAGSQISVSWKNRNTFRGAELFTVKVTGGFETQYGGNIRRPNTYQAGIEPSLTIPRFIVPFFEPHTSSRYTPKTKIYAGYDLLYRSTLFRLHTFKGGFGYNWKEDARKEHELFPVNITYVRADTLNQDSVSQINFSNLLFNGIIFGPKYTYTYNTRGDGDIHQHDFYFTGELDLSGNIVGLAQGTSVDKEPKKILGSVYAQYVKATAELRHYNNYDINKNAIWANRVLVGFGLPYGNSQTLPNVKQYFAGGNSSLRGFRSRLLGPGTFNEQYSTGNRTFIETNGDIKLELNTELRAPLYSFIHGAVFIDAGNIWTYRENANFPGGKFTPSFYKEIAVSGGVGIRLDFNILVLRFDFGIPLRKPWLPENERWVFDKIAFGDPSWRGQNLIFNLAIGYPF